MDVPPKKIEDPFADVLGQKLTDDEAEIQAIYSRLDDLHQRQDLPPCARANIEQARALLWNLCNDLGLV